MCAGAQFATGNASCWETPVWEVSDPDWQIAGRKRYACNRHVHGVIDRERGSLVMPYVPAAEQCIHVGVFARGPVDGSTEHCFRCDSDVPRHML